MSETIGQRIDAALNRIRQEKRRLESKRDQLVEQQESVKQELGTIASSLMHIAREEKKALMSLLREEGIDVAAEPRAEQAASESGTKSSGGRMTAEQKAAMMGRVAELAQSNPNEGISRGDVTDELNISGPSASNLLKQLVEEGKLRREGEKAATRYYPA